MTFVRLRICVVMTHRKFYSFNTSFNCSTMKIQMSQFLWVLSFLLISTVALQAQNITGVVNDENGLSMPGVTVRIEGTTQGDATDLDGKYEIKGAPVGEQVLVFSFIGYTEYKETINVAPTGTVTVNRDMEVDAETLEEFIVVGYGVQRKREVTGSIVKVGSKELTDIPTPSFEAGLQGKAAGVQVTQGSGLAGSASIVRVRGIASISAAGDPLYVVDGIPITQDYFLNGNRGAMNNNPLATINPNDIESVEILKDAAATGIYGSRGANGVILITTKSGSGTGWDFSLDARLGVSVPTARPNMLNSSQYLQLFQEAWENDGNVGLAPLPGAVSWEDARRTDTDWVDETIGVGFKQSYNFSANFGTKKLKLFSSIGYDDNGSYLIGNSYVRSSFRTNATYKVNDKLDISANISVSEGVNNRVDAAWSGGLGAAMSTALPIYPIFHPDTVFDGDVILHLPTDYWDNVGGANPVRQRELQEWRVREFRSISNINIEYRPIKNMFIKIYGGYDYLDLKDDKFTDALLINGERNSGVNNLAERWSSFNNNWNTNGTVTYIHDIDDKNSLTYMIGTEYQEARSLSKGRVFRQDASVNAPFYEDPDLLNQELGEEMIGDSTVVIPGFDVDGQNRTEVYNFISGFGRVNYARENKYFGQVSFRADGSSRFGPNNKFGFFPSASVGWVLSEEKFLKANESISFMKLRAGWGITGNASIPNYLHYGEYQRSFNGYNDQDFRYLTVAPNPDLQWETSNIFDIALEMGFLDDRITTTLSYYNKTTTDVLLRITPQPSTGFQEFWDNVGEIVNRGVEFEVSTINMDRERFTWRTSFNVSYNYNEIVSIGNYSEDAISGGTNDTRVVVGDPVGTNYLVRFGGVDPQTGRNIYLDINGNPTNTWDPADRVASGRVLPIAVGGITNTFEFGRWTAGIVMIFSVGSDIYDSSSKRQNGVVTDWNMRTEVFDRWRQEGDEAEFARLSRLVENYGLDRAFNNNTTQFLDDGDYLRVRRVSVTYNFPQFNIAKAGFKGASVTLSASNIFTLTNFDGLDPEIARDFEDATDRNMSPNITYLTPPQEMSFNLAFNLRF
ncbi:MAG: TonB-linked SusC/RagA family outer membrane protein [Cryomorphaceae bacterium]|jgi:TonB-linked SusC/RagA family outer membrane protein